MTAAPDLRGLLSWLEAVTTRHGDVLSEIRLTGSRSCGAHRPGSDWDVLLLLADEVYADPADAAQAEQAITFDHDLPAPAEGLDQFILRPDGSLVRWEQWDVLAPLADFLHDDSFRVVNGLVQGPCGDFSRFFKEWPQPPVIWAADLKVQQ